MRPTLLTRRAIAAAVVTPLLLLGAACGGDQAAPGATDTGSDPASVAAPGSSGSPDTAGSAGRTESGDADSAAAAPGETGSWDEETLVPAMMAAIAEQRTSRFTMTTTGGGVDVRAEGAMSYRGKHQDLAVTMSGATLGARDMEMRVVDGVVYLSMPPMTPQGKFLEIRPGEEGSPYSGMLDQLRLDPRDSVKAFEPGLRDLQYLGTESVDGQTLERYRVTVDFSAAAKAQGLPHLQGAPKQVEYDLWLDQDALLRRLELDLMQVGVVMEVTDWGAPVRITAPPPRRIVQTPGSAAS